jgi:CheY-like chemotaxis protein
MAVILVVEDDVFIRQVAEMMIQDWGHDILSASDADERLYSCDPINALTHSLPTSI